MGRKIFNRAAGDSARPQDRRSTHGTIQTAGTLTNAHLDKLARDEPKEPAPELRFEMDDIRAASHALARTKHCDMIEKLRTRLRCKSADGRKAFQRQARSERGGDER
ncbi:hypothetical protein [Leisingera sp. M658]|uniref:hypothetical protein n=1 Tax=Leisingera sp. M658 TaxID=2867015 RepID=UPI0021A845F0|nr:hypothetical protein [Leisingera sp. M658]UWQ73596.1 hypothetical protein K3724_13680 [Leisingera sp. M658]